MKNKNIKKYIYLIFYYFFARKLPSSTFPVIGLYSKKIRYLCCKNIFKNCGIEVNIERNAYFGTGLDIEIGDYSGIGIDCFVPSNIKIGAHVMMAPDVLIHKHNHSFDNIYVPITNQGIKYSKPVQICDDVWIGQRAIINPGRTIAKGSIVASGTVLVRDFPEYSIIGGNPSRLIRSRK